MTMFSVLFTGLGIWQVYLHIQKKNEISGENLIQSVTTSDIASIIKDERAYLYNSFISFGIVLVCVIVIIIYTVLRSKLKKEKTARIKILAIKSKFKNKGSITQFFCVRCCP